MNTMARVRALMEQQDINQSALARIADSDNATVSMWFSGQRKPNIKHLQAIAEYFDVSVDYLLGRPAYSYAYLKLQDKPEKAYMPLYGRVHAGTGSEPDIIDNTVPVPYEIWEKHKDAILLEVEGDCMDKVLPPGCLVMIDKHKTPSQSSIVVANIEGDYLIRRYSRGATTLLLSPESHNPEHKDLVITDKTVELVGVVVWYQPKRELE